MPANQSCCSVTPAPASPSCSEGWGGRPANRAAGSATSPPRNWSTNSSKPPTNGSSPVSSPATDDWTYSASTNSDTSKSTLAEQNYCSRSSPNVKNRLGRDRDQLALQRVGHRLPRPSPGRCHRRPRHLQRPHPSDRHQLLPITHQHDRHPSQTGQLNQVGPKFVPTLGPNHLTKRMKSSATTLSGSPATAKAG